MSALYPPKVLVLGPQSLSLDDEAAKRLRQRLFDTPRLTWAIHALQNLCTSWHRPASAIPILQHLDGETILHGLASWLQTGDTRHLIWPLPNVVLTPLTVVQQLVDLEEEGKIDFNTQFGLFPHYSELVGLCTGLLAASALSCSENEDQFAVHGATIIRLAMLVGGVVDAHDLSLSETERAVSFSVHWTQKDGRVKLSDILETIPAAYISVAQDEHKATVTTSKVTSRPLLDRLQKSGFSAAEISLRGYFHWQGHLVSLRAVLAFCTSDPEFSLNGCARLTPPIRSNDTGLYMKEDGLHRTIIRSMLVDQSKWHKVFTKLQSSTGRVRIESIGSERCVPVWAATRALPDITLRMEEPQAQTSHDAQTTRLEDQEAEPQSSRDHIAVIGMGCNVPGAADMGEFWDLLCSASSQHVEVPTGRFDLATPWRQPDQRRWYGNFISDCDAFDNRFFKKSAREAASTDPQHRLMLQTAYQAVEQSGYLSMDRDKNIGCYIATGSGDYQENIACHPANAYSATGNLKAFAAGRISHYFGWTGPGLTIDSACSSSAVAIHLACQGILSNDCTAALVGGVNIISGPEWFYNLAGASFLSPTGQCKPFDAAADGYCRGEAVGAVMLKRLSSAIQDGDQVFGIIGASAVQQNENCTAITVPHEASLSGLFQRVIQKAGVTPADISYVEAHGTGTAVGDPAEYEGIRRVIGGPARAGGGRLSVGSIKGLTGHAESAAGIVALLKILAMLHHGAIPPQASFQKASPTLRTCPADLMDICTTLRPWDSRQRAALINNYGASGSNASLLVLQPPGHVSTPNPSLIRVPVARERSGSRHPFGFYASDEQALQRYIPKLLTLLQSKASPDLSAMSFQVARQANRALRRLLSFSCDSVCQLEERLKEWAPTEVTVVPPPRPIVLCFGGQKSRFVGLDKQVYDAADVFRDHLDRCNAICEALGTTIYPAVFEKAPINDIVKLNAAIFSVQYSSGRSWLDCMPKSANVEAVVGHSIGELSALCVSGAVALEDMLRYIIERARLIRDKWGPENGSMLAVEAELVEVTRILAESAALCQDEHAVSIACFNGPRSFTLAGPAKGIDAFVMLAKSGTAFVKCKRLDVTNAYHCSLTSSILEEVQELASSVRFCEPRIRVEHATEEEYRGRLDGALLIDHFRRPVYFSHAVQRLAKRVLSAIWLEAGSNSGVTLMANRALEEKLPELSSTSHFQPISIASSNLPMAQSLADATVALWKEGFNVSFWPHHQSQTKKYPRIMLPPHQFEKARHWVGRKSLECIANSSSPTSSNPDTLWSFISYQDAQKRSVRFRVNTDSEKFQCVVKSHVVAHTHPLCPSILQLDIAIEALSSLQPRFMDGTWQPQLLGMESHVPMPLDSLRTAWLDAHTTDPDASLWVWTISSEVAMGSETMSNMTTHVTGKITFRPSPSPGAVSDFGTFERLVRRESCLSLLNDMGIDDVVQGQRSIYRIFSDVVEYGTMLQGVQRIVGKDGKESAGRVVRTGSQQSWLDFAMADSFCQVAGIFINCMTERLPGEMYISDRIEQYIRSPLWPRGRQRPDVFEVYACHGRPSSKEYLSDVFVFDSKDGSLVEVILGIHFRHVSKSAFSRMLGVTEASGSAPGPPLWARHPADEIDPASRSDQKELNGASHEEHMLLGSCVCQNDTDPTKAHADTASRLKHIIASLSGLDAAEIDDISQLSDLGIDSLMGMELSREIENAFKCTTYATLVMDLTDFRSLVSWVEEAIVTPRHRTSTNTEAITDRSALKKPRNTGVFPQVLQTHDRPSQNSLPRPLEDNGQDATQEVVLSTFRKFAQATDTYIMENRLAGYVEKVLPLSDALCIALICNALEQLDCPIRSAAPGQKLPLVHCLPRHNSFINLLYEMLESHAGLIRRTESSDFIRTAVPAPCLPGGVQSFLRELDRRAPEHKHNHDLTMLVGARLADCLMGKADCAQLIFGTPESRETLSAMYSHSPINAVWIKQMSDFVETVVPRLPRREEGIRILELGAGTGGTTSRLVPLLVNLQPSVPVSYTVTDVSPSLVAGARQRFKQHPFVGCQILDLEESLASDSGHLDSYDIVLATNCVHATQNLANTSRNIRKMLRPDGFLLMLEMTEPLVWVDLIFGLVDGWWLFNDGRKHALASPELWRKTLHDAGFDQVEWTTGILPESSIQRLILATGSASTGAMGWSLGGPNSIQVDRPVSLAQEMAVDDFVRQYTAGFTIKSTKVPVPSLNIAQLGAFPSVNKVPVVLITGATGSLGSHLLHYLSSLPEVGMVICLNRTSSLEAYSRQRDALHSKGLGVDDRITDKWRVFQTDTHRPLLGLSQENYHFLVRNVTHIVHNAWPMSIRRPIQDFESQFKAMRNLIDLARDAHNCQTRSIAFQFVSSIAVVGLHPVCTGQQYVLEEPVSVESVLPNGYGKAKLACERMLAETLQRFPAAFDVAMTVRIGQIAGSRTTGYWNPVEHFAFMMKSSQTLGCLPDLKGSLSWCPVDDVASTLGELLLSPSQKHPIYHIENPMRQDWEPMIRWLGAALGIYHIIPYGQWLGRVRDGEASMTTDQLASNPAANLADFLEKHFQRMSCGGIVLSTEKSRAAALTLSKIESIDQDLVTRYVRCWKETGLLSTLTREKVDTVIVD